jgi:SAM-dependent methyltransferase
LNTEFDDYARDYNAGMEDPIKAALGKSANVFLLAKIELLFRYLRRNPRIARDNAEIRLLDFGCGTGDFLALLSEQDCSWQMEGCDLSGGMVGEAKSRYPALRSPGTLWVCDSERFPQSCYDVITVVCVLHHIPPAAWPACLSRLRSALRPGGVLAIFEHNPWNPMTRWIVSRAAIDRNAVLLSPRMARRMMKTAGFSIDMARFFLFLPPRFRPLRQIERVFACLPIGGQYFLTGRP